MLRDDIGLYAAEVLGKPIVVVHFPGVATGYDLSVVSFGDLRAAASPGGMPLQDVAIFVHQHSHYSLLVPTGDFCLGFDEAAYPAGSFEEVGSFTLMGAGEDPSSRMQSNVCSSRLRHAGIFMLVSSASRLRCCEPMHAMIAVLRTIGILLGTHCLLPCSYLQPHVG